MDGVGHGLPGGDLIFVPNAWDVGVAGGLRSDERCFADQKRARNRSTLRIVLGNHGEGDILVVGSEPGEGSHDQAVLKRHGPDLEGLEELRARGGCGGAHDGVEYGAENLVAEGNIYCG